MGDGHMHMIFQDPATANSKDVPITSRGHTVQEWEYHPVHAYGRKDQVDGRGIAAEEGHFYMECSNKGVCDRKTGLCECFDGFEGRSCHRMVCPGGFDCNGHGTCQYIKTMRTHNGERQDGTAWGYDLWDVNTARACVCDKGWAGVDCAVCAHVVMIRCPPATIQALMRCRRCKLTAQAVRMLEVASSLSTRTRMVSSGAPRTLRLPAGVQRDLLSLNLRLCPTV